jgi:hypothetical protein
MHHHHHNHHHHQAPSGVAAAAANQVYTPADASSATNGNTYQPFFLKNPNSNHHNHHTYKLPLSGNIQQSKSIESLLNESNAGWFQYFFPPDYFAIL